MDIGHKKEYLFTRLNTGKHVITISLPIYKIQIGHQNSSKQMKRLSRH